MIILFLYSFYSLATSCAKLNQVFVLISLHQRLSICLRLLNTVITATIASDGTRYVYWSRFDLSQLVSRAYEAVLYLHGRVELNSNSDASPSLLFFLSLPIAVVVAVAAPVAVTLSLAGLFVLFFSSWLAPRSAQLLSTVKARSFPSAHSNLNSASSATTAASFSACSLSQIGPWFPSLSSSTQLASGPRDTESNFSS